MANYSLIFAQPARKSNRRSHRVKSPHSPRSRKSAKPNSITLSLPHTKKPTSPLMLSLPTKPLLQDTLGNDDKTIELLGEALDKDLLVFPLTPKLHEYDMTPRIDKSSSPHNLSDSREDDGEHVARIEEVGETEGPAVENELEKDEVSSLVISDDIVEVETVAIAPTAIEVVVPGGEDVTLEVFIKKDPETPLQLSDEGTDPVTKVLENVKECDMSQIQQREEQLQTPLAANTGDKEKQNQSNQTPSFLLDLGLLSERPPSLFRQRLKFFQELDKSNEKNFVSPKQKRGANEGEHISAQPEKSLSVQYNSSPPPALKTEEVNTLGFTKSLPPTKSNYTSMNANRASYAERATGTPQLGLPTNGGALQTSQEGIKTQGLVGQPKGPIAIASATQNSAQPPPPAVPQKPFSHQENIHTIEDRIQSLTLMFDQLTLQRKSSKEETPPPPDHNLLNDPIPSMIKLWDQFNSENQ
eukprot:TRINITY_DN8602_c1_g1_i1.p1 TRINITY_DN8602_c1_g1~~TRINITY_DN8602_c1_g1_i1.p1  ORF type:complete len:470 (-),score=129.65 TRINITY_DN8602_c1_g1_i1:44-1453(-)